MPAQINAETVARQDLAHRLSVSRETLEQLDIFAALLAKWTARINLISRADQNRLWSRHIADSLALMPRFREPPVPELWADIGSGGGLPVMPLAIAAKAEGLATRFVAIEADHRKAAFLRTVNATLGLSVSVQVQRAETVELSGVDIVSARGFSEIDGILGVIAAAGWRPREVWLLKGLRVDGELTRAARDWHIDYQRTVNPMGSDGYILRLKGRSCDDRRGNHGR